MSSSLVLKATGLETLQMGGFQDQQVPLCDSRVSEQRSESAANPKTRFLPVSSCRFISAGDHTAALTTEPLHQGKQR